MWEAENFQRKYDELMQLVNDLSIKYLQRTNPGLRSDMWQLRNQLISDIGRSCLTWKGATDIVSEQIARLKDEDTQITLERARLYIIVRKEKEENATNLIIANVGFIAGGMEFYGGLGGCVASLGAACAGLGLPMMVHGANNLYENGYYLLYRQSGVGTAREAYRYAAKKLGYGNREADMVYGTVDLALSGYGAFHKSLRPRMNSWGLFRHIRSDYILGWQEMPKIALGMELLGDGITGWQIYTLGAKG